MAHGGVPSPIAFTRGHRETTDTHTIQPKRVNSTEPTQTTQL